tara:strand:- start:4332 stop:6278 length:1947 start_codon:yes stop_codon:yes gene_type:complete
MKNIYSFFLIFLSPFLIIAQAMNNEVVEHQINTNDNVFYSVQNQTNNFLATSAAPIWEEDFANGFPSGWSSYTNNTQGGFATCPWVHSFDGSWGYYQGTQGMSGAAAINSTTASNGFLISDSDSANHHAYGQPSGTTYQYIESYFTTSAIDLSMYPAVSLEFEHTFRYNNLGQAAFVPPTVSISNDSINWTDYVVNAAVPNNTGSNNPEVVSLNISSVAGNQSTVYIKIGWTSRCYYWMLDDMKIVETPPHLIGMQDETFGGWLLSNPTTTGDMGIPYTFNPMKQAMANPYRIEANILNMGGVDQTNTQLNTIISDQSGATVYFSDNSSPVILPVMDTISVGTQNTFTPTTYGYHNVDIWASSDSASTDTTSRGTVVTDTVYGRDYDWASDGANAGGGYYLGRVNCGQVLANAFEIYAPDTVTSISFHVSDQSVVGAELNVEVYEYDPTGNINTTGQILLGQSDPYTLTGPDIGNWVTLKLLNPVSLIPGTGNVAYLAAVRGSQHPLDTSLISSSGEDGVVSFVQDNGCDIGSGGLNYWYSVARTLMIRMNLGEIAVPASIVESQFNGTLFLYPNPSNDIVNIELNNVQNDFYDISVKNILSQVVYSNSFKVNNYLTESIDFSNYEKGTYIVTVKNSDSITTRKIIIE